jgi:hypothetical protein
MSYFTSSIHSGRSLGTGTNNLGRALQTDDELLVGGKDVRQQLLIFFLCLRFLLGSARVHCRPE